MDTQLILGSVVFLGMEIPSSINFGGDQRLTVHELIGGQRIVDAMGRADDDISWSGLFFGEGALDRAVALDALRIAGQPVSLIWYNFRYNVVVKSYKAQFERFYQIPYSLTLQVVQDFTQPPLNLFSLLGIDDSIFGDLTTINTITGLIGNSSLSSSVSKLTGALTSVSSFANSSAATVQAFLPPLTSAQNTVNALITSTRARIFGS